MTKRRTMANLTGSPALGQAPEPEEEQLQFYVRGLRFGLMARISFEECDAPHCSLHTEEGRAAAELRRKVKYRLRKQA